MDIKKSTALIGRIILLTLVGFITSAIASAVVPQPDILKAAPSADGSETVQMLFLMRFVLAVIFALIIETCYLSSIRLMAVLFWVAFGVTTFVMQLETIIFAKAFPAITTSDVGLFILSSGVDTLLFVPLAVLIMGKRKNNHRTIPSLFHHGYWSRIILLAVIYPALYFAFGILIAWQSSAVRDFYATSTIVNTQVILAAIQFGRGILWVLAGLPLFAIFTKRRNAVIASTLCYALFPSIALILPNPLMPELVRLAHFVEISLSMAVFGFIAGLIMTGARKNEIL
jgi:hypothetical protein